MKGYWKIIARMAIPLIHAAGVAKQNEDADNVGEDDIIGTSLVYAADLLSAIVEGSTVPKAPASLK